MAYASKTMATAFASAIAALLITQSATAVTPTAVWVKNLGQSYTIDGKTYAVTLRNGTLNQDGTITVSSTWGHPAPYIDMDGKGIGTISILVKYSGLDINQVYNADADSIGVAFSSIVDSDTNVVGSCVQKVNGVANNTVRAYHCAVSATSATPRDIGNMTAVEGTGYLLFSYTDSEGSRTYMGTSIAELTGGQDTAGHWSGRTLKKIVLGGDESGKAFNGAGFKIEEVALFINEYYTASDVASYEFPAKIYTSDVNVSTINTDFSDASEIDVYLADGVTVTGDTTFTATKVNFHCYGSFNMTPPANNEATFDFSDVAGSPVIIYNGATPTVSGSKFTSNVIPSFVTDSTQWTGTIWIKNVAVSNFAPSNFGNANSTVRLSGVSGHFAQGSVSCAPAIELVNDSYQYGFYVSDGFSRSAAYPNNVVVINKLKGNGALWTGNLADTVLMQVLDWSEYSGSIQLVNKIVVFGSYLPTVSEFNTSGGIYIGANETVAIPSGKEWRADGKVHVYGTFKATGLSQLKSAVANSNPATIVHAYDSGTFVLTTNATADDMNTDYSKITGTGTLRYEGNAYRTISTNNFPTTMTVDNRLTAGILHRIPGLEITIGSLAGDGYLRSDWSGTSSDRDLRVLQAKDTTWSGKFWTTNPHRFRSLIVAPGATSSGTLTISATHEAAESTGLTVESGAKVNLTGTWVGATTVAGTLGGTGTITGDVTLSEGATLKVNDLADPLTVTGAFTVTGAVTIELPEGASLGTVVKTTSKPDISGAKFTVKVGGVAKTLKVSATANGLAVRNLPFVILFR